VHPRQLPPQRGHAVDDHFPVQVDRPVVVTQTLQQCIVLGTLLVERRGGVAQGTGEQAVRDGIPAAARLALGRAPAGRALRVGAIGR
jgi:hypothetical protein